MLYQCNPTASETLRSLARCTTWKEKISLAIWDNSPEPIGDGELAWIQDQFPGSTYEHHPENESLAVIYNQTIRRYFNTNLSSIYDKLILFDQDSRFSEDVLDAIERGFEGNPEINVLLPIVRTKNSIVSPARLYGCWGRPFSKLNPGIRSSRYLTAINSGMAIRGTYLVRDFSGYDERLRFYGTDNYFMKKYAETNPHVAILSAVIDHDLSRDNPESPEIRLWRHRDLIRGILVTESGWISSIVAHIYCFIYSLKTALRYRDKRFLQWT